MNFNEYIDIIEKRLTQNFDIAHDVTIMDQNIPLFAKMEVHNEKYFAAKSVKVWRAENYEYCFVQFFDHVNEATVEQFQRFLIEAVDHYVTPHSEHMSSIITGIMAVDDFPPSLEKKIKQFKHKKMYSFSFKGWSDIRLIVVNLHSNRVISNRKGREVQEFYLPKKGDKKNRFSMITK